MVLAHFFAQRGFYIKLVWANELCGEYVLLSVATLTVDLWQALALLRTAVQFWLQGPSAINVYGPTGE